MRKQDAKAFSDSYPLIVIFIMMLQARGGVQLVLAGFAALATISFIPVVANLAWAPMLKKAGLWWTALLLGCAIVSVIIGAGITGPHRGGSHGIGNALLGAATSGLLFSWVLAAMNCAEDTASSNPYSGPTPIRSRLIRGRGHLPQ
jgi:hypothetical protein